MYVGVDYYPEHWDKERLKTDVKLIKEAGFNVVRLAEFGWYSMEPEEGKYQFDWLDEAINTLSSQGIKVILGTPTAVVPSWAAHKYPSIMATQASGQRIPYGVRKDTCYSDLHFNHLSDKIVTEMTKYFGLNENVIGWQTDNEFSTPYCYCQGCLSAFQSWLKDKYKSVHLLNSAWGLHFWNQQVNEWEEIVFPAEKWACNPSQYLDHKRFHSDMNVKYQLRHIELIHAHSPNRLITHNLMGFYPELNYFDLAKDLDFVSWDNYPNFGNIGGGEKPQGTSTSLELTPRVKASAAADLMRGIKNKNFWIMEQTAGPIGWGEFSRNVWPGELRNITYQQVAHGCDGMLWFRWRTCTAGREQYWHGLLGHDAKTGRRYEEAQKTAFEFSKISNDILDSEVPADVAFIYDYDSLWSLQSQPGYTNCDYINSLLHYYNGFYKRGINTHIIAKDADFSQYKILIISHLSILPDEIAAKINNYVANGGVILVDCRTGVKDETNLCHERTLPGLLSDSLGIQINEYESLEGLFVYDIHSKNGNSKYQAHLYSDWITTITASSLYSYTTPHVSEFEVLTRNICQQGYGYYLGTIVKDEAFYDELTKMLLTDAGLPVPDLLPYGVEHRIRTKNNHDYHFYINQLNISVNVCLQNGYDILTNRQLSGNYEMSAMEVLILKVNHA